MSSAAARKAWNEAMKATAGSALPPALQQRATKRRSGRNSKQERRAKARRIHTNDAANDEYRAAVWLDALEGVDLSAAAEVDDEEFDELEELQGASRKPKKRAKAHKTGVIPRRFLPRSLATILVEEANKDGGVAREFLAAEAHVKTTQQLPARKFCPVTGLEGIYREPRSNICYVNLSALEQIRERPPPWLNLTGAVAFHEAVKSIRDDSG